MFKPRRYSYVEQLLFTVLFYGGVCVGGGGGGA